MDDLVESLLHHANNVEGLGPDVREDLRDAANAIKSLREDLYDAYDDLAYWIEVATEE